MSAGQSANASSAINRISSLIFTSLSFLLIISIFAKDGLKNKLKSPEIITSLPSRNGIYFSIIDSAILV